MKRLKDISLSNKGHLYFLLCLGIILSFINIFFLIISIYIFVKAYHKLNKIILSLIVILLLISQFLFIMPKDGINGIALVSSKEIRGSYYSYELYYGLSYYDYISKQDLHIGDIIYIDARVIAHKKATIPYGFDLNIYKKSKNNLGTIRLNSEIKILFNVEFLSVISEIRNLDIPIINLFKEESLIDDDLFSYIFKLSSVHLLILGTMIESYLKYLDIKNDKKKNIQLLVYCILWILFPSFVLFRFIILILYQITKDKYGFGLSKLDLNSFIFIISVIIFPNLIYDLSFIMINVIIFTYSFKSLNSKLSNETLFMLVILPFFIYFNSSFNVVYFLVSFLLYKVFKKSVIYLVLVATILKDLKLLDAFEIFINELSSVINSHDLTIYIGNIDLYFVLFVLIILLIVLYQNTIKKYLIASLLYLSIITLLVVVINIDTSDYCLFLDVGQGDSAVIRKNNKIIVVDAFENVSYYLKKSGIKRIDYLILTHNDLDHMKEASILLDSFNVDVLILSGYQNYNITFGNILYIDENNLVSLTDIDLDFLGPIKYYSSKNDSSVVFKINVCNKDYLFLGDISMDVEIDLIAKYSNKLKSDVLKIAHHGSITSTSTELIVTSNPTYAVISVGLNNTYDHPSDTVINRLRRYNIKYYVTSLEGSVKFTCYDVINYPP